MSPWLEKFRHEEPAPMLSYSSNSIPRGFLGNDTFEALKRLIAPKSECKPLARTQVHLLGGIALRGNVHQDPQAPFTALGGTWGVFYAFAKSCSRPGAQSSQ